MFDDPRNSTGDLGSDCGTRFAAQMFVVAVFGDGAFERVSKAVGPQQVSSKCSLYCISTCRLYSMPRTFYSLSNCFSRCVGRL